MANQYTPEEIQEIFDEYHRSLAAGIPVSKDLADRLKDATVGIKNYTYQLNQSFRYLGQQSKALGIDLMNGAKGASTFNGALDAAGDAASNVAAGFGPLGIAVGLVIKALTFFVAQANKQSDRLFETFQNLSRSGAAGAQGMTDVFQSMKSFGYTIDELDKMTSTLAEHSRDFALFGGTAATGSKDLANLVDGFKDARVNLQSLGLSTDEQVRAAGGYYKQLGRLGKATEATSAGALAYIKEMDTLTRLTGLQRKELEEQREAAEAIDAFQAALAEAPADIAKNMRETFNRLSAIDPQLAQGYAESVNGMITGSEAQMKYLQSTGFKGLELSQQQLTDASMTASKFGDALAGAYKETLPLQRQFAKIGITDYFGSGRAHTLLANKEFTKSAEQAATQTNDLYEGMDEATRAQAQLRVVQIDSSNSMQSFVNIGVTPATKALAYLTEVVENLTSLLPGSKTKEQQTTRGYGARGTGSVGGSLAATGAGAATGAAAGSLLGPVGTAVGGIVGGLLGYAGYQTSGGAAATDAISGKDLGGLDSGFRDKFLAAAAEYYQITGTKVNVNSAYRSPEKQQELYNNYISGRSSIPAAPPGQSKHNVGRAVDVDQQIAEDMDRRGLLSKYGLSRPVAGDPIHIEGFAGFNGRLSGPMSGYRPNVLMHGNEQISIKPSGVGSNSPTADASEGTMLKLIDRIDDLIYVNRSQLGVAEKILKYQH